MSTYHFNISKCPRLQAYLVFFVATCFYLYEYVLQVAPSVMAEPMMQTFGVTAQGFGLISACYFYAYAPMQLPAGILFDRYGPRRLMTCALCLCALGSFFFASTESLWTAGLGRWFIGIGSAFSFIGVLVLLSRWFPPNYFAVLAGVTQLMSSVGAMCGEVPLAALVNKCGWRYSSFLLAAIGLVLAGFMWWIIRDYPVTPTTLPMKPCWRDEGKRLLKVCRRVQTWIIGSYAFCIWTPIAVFGALWGVPYCQQRFGVSILVASSLCSMIWLGIGVGSPLLGWISDRMCSRRIALVISALCGLSASCYVLYALDASLGSMYIALFLFGIGAGGQTVSFAVINDTVPADLVGTASGFNNLSVLLGAAIFQPVVGIILDHEGGYRTANDLLVYSIASYQKALLVVPVCFFMAFLISLWVMRETHPHST